MTETVLYETIMAFGKQTKISNSFIIVCQQFQLRMILLFIPPSTIG